MIRTIFIISLILSSGLSFGQRGANPFSTLRVDSVVFYDFNPKNHPEESIINEDGIRSPMIVKSVKLDKLTADRFTMLLGQKSSYGRATAACFEPHLGVVYYFGKKPVAYLNICLGCNVLEPSLKLSAQLQGKEGEADAIYYTDKGMSKSFRKEINQLLIKYNFSHQLDGQSAFDN